GHNAPQLFRKTGEVESLGPTGIPIGILREASYTQHSCHLDPGELIVLFSDGITEACAAGADEEFGQEGLIRAVREAPTNAVADLIQEIKSRVLSFTKAAPP